MTLTQEMSELRFVNAGSFAEPFQLLGGEVNEFIPR